MAMVIARCTMATADKATTTTTMQKRITKTEPKTIDIIWYRKGMVWYGMVWYAMLCYEMLWYEMLWNGMVYYAMIYD